MTLGKSLPFSDPHFPHLQNKLLQDLSQSKRYMGPVQGWDMKGLGLGCSQSTVVWQWWSTEEQELAAFSRDQLGGWGCTGGCGAVWLQG